MPLGGCERLSPYVNNLKKPSTEYPKSMIFMAIMVAVTALLGTFAMGLMFDPNNIPKDLMMNGAYYSFSKLGEYYGIGQTFVIIYAICTALGQAATLAISIDAPIKILLSDVDPQFVPKVFTKVNAKGVPVTGYKLTAILVSILLIVPALGIGGHDQPVQLADPSERGVHAAPVSVGVLCLHDAEETCGQLCF